MFVSTAQHGVKDKEESRTEAVVREIKPRSGTNYPSEANIRIVLEGLSGECSKALELKGCFPVGCFPEWLTFNFNEEKSLRWGQAYVIVLTMIANLLCFA